MNWTAPERPNELTESRLIEAILTGVFPAGTNLPGERELAEQMGVTRPTLRTVLQRLARDGWLEIRQGKPTRVRDYWLEGNLAVLSSIVQHQDAIPPGFVENLFDVRILLAPAYTRLAVTMHPEAVIEALDGWDRLSDDPQVFADFDWKLHRALTILSENSVFTLFINTVQEMYSILGKIYYSSPELRSHSCGFYGDLLMSARKRDGEAAGVLAERIMVESKNLFLGR